MYAYIFFNRLSFAPEVGFHYHPVFVQAAMMLCAAVALALLAFRGRFDLRPDARSCLALGALFIVGVAVDQAGLVMGGQGGLAVQLFACMLFGCAFVLYTLLWVQVYEVLPLPRLFAAVSCALVLSALARAVTYVDMRGQGVWCVAFCAVMALSLTMLNRSFRIVSAGATRSEGPLGRERFAKGLLFTLRGPFAAAAAVAFGTGLTWGEAAVEEYRPPIALAAAFLVCALNLVFGFCGRNGPKARSALFGAVFPLSTILLLASLVLGRFDGAAGLPVLFDAMYYVGLSLFEVHVLVAIIVASRGSGVSSLAPFAAKMVVYGAGFLAGKALSFALDPASLPAVLTAVLLAYLAFNVVVLAVNQVSDAAGSSAPVQEAISMRMGERYGLTPREKEVLSCLLEGRSYEGIGRTLFISSSTVKTHVKHIYEKVGVGSRDELIDQAF
ncbi:helix-turn-helix transcriptional regulator [Gordonibacter sp. An230]|uniref:helix-turn-helix transcriptional regulator n=1 Tax=Gordonibacter sp. An230 TaxID=1965592 RepID=UPI00111FA35A|nr:helix-turn-helix transcriptional regulator [Gordonibacter sp. An230]